jgi:hypothetical protein
MNSEHSNQRVKQRIGRIMNDSWVCRKGCYHTVGDKRCQCECHWWGLNALKEIDYLKRQTTKRRDA